MGTKKIKVLQVLASLQCGGAESRILDVYRKINLSEIEFDFVCMQEGKQFYEDEICLRGGKVIKIQHPRSSGAVRNLIQLVTIIKEGDYDVVHAHTSFHCGLVMFAAWISKVPVRVAHARTTSTEHQNWKNKIFLMIGRSLIGRLSTDRLAVSDEAGKYLFGGKQYRIVPNAIDYKKYGSIQENQIEALKKEFLIPDNKTIIGMVGRFEPMKNHEFAVKWFARYAKKNYQSMLIFVGDGPKRAYIEELVKSFNLCKQVVFTGIRKDIDVWMNVFDVLIVPSLYEGLGGVILEAQAAGTPVLKSDSFTDAADLNIGLVSSVSVEKYENWNAEIEMLLNVQKPSANTIQKAFCDKEYSLEKEIEILEGIYGVSSAHNFD